MSKRRRLSSIDIRRLLAGHEGFLGVFPINRVKNVNPPKHTDISFIANLQADNLPGNHWVAIRRRSDNTGQYFDSFGRVPPLEIQNWFMKHSSRWAHNKQILQKDGDNVSCGYLCVKFIKNK